MDFSSFFYSIAGCSATIIAIVGGFIASKLISISSDRDNILDKIKEIDDEINIKTKQRDDVIEKLDDNDAIEFVRNNVSMLVDRRSIDIVYKPEEKPELDYFKMGKYWKRALKICDEISSLDEEQFCDVNSDKVPVVLAQKYKNEFDYEVCKKVLFEIERRIKRNAGAPYYSWALIGAGDVVVPQTAGFWYHEKRKEAEKIKFEIQELQYEKIQYEEKKKKIRKPKGMKSGLIIFITFSLLGVFFPLLCALINSIEKISSLCMPIMSFCLFILCVLITFIYMALLLKWKNVDVEVNEHERSSLEGKL